eukprot:TRINITY_DN2982_c0_g1_i1.p2 TRINITY_DN2982_c0_g1~~TRINITY_DN2982_c0_g1_i1.p2  ORF type:complete len:123 (+),score=29.27 TRINITY_DN2982_c0_g1_i1:2-370(+)
MDASAHSPLAARRLGGPKKAGAAERRERRHTLSLASGEVRQRLEEAAGRSETGEERDGADWVERALLGTLLALRRSPRATDPSAAPPAHPEGAEGDGDGGAGSPADECEDMLSFDQPYDAAA